MAKHFEFTYMNSDVYVVGNSQVDGFKGKHKKYPQHGMNISMRRGATILDCLNECARRYQNKNGKVYKLYFNFDFKIFKLIEININK